MWRENEHIKPTIPIPTPAPALLWLLGVVYHPAATISPFNTALPLVEPYPLYSRSFLSLIRRMVRTKSS